jgi:hypothetical protein
MARALAFVCLVTSLGAAAYLASRQMQESGPASPAATHAITVGQEIAGGVNLQQAAAALDEFRTANGTFAGAPVGGLGVRLVRADTTSYCIETDSAGALFHEAGPNGSPAAGPC